MWSLILGISSLICLGFLGGVPAIFLSTAAKRRIRRSGGNLTGSGLATAGLITGIIGTVFSVLGFLLIVAAASHGSSGATNAVTVWRLAVP